MTSSRLLPMRMTLLMTSSCLLSCRRRRCCYLCWRLADAGGEETCDEMRHYLESQTTIILILIF